MRDATLRVNSCGAEQAERVCSPARRPHARSPSATVSCAGLLALPRMVEVADGGVGVGAGDAVGGQAQVQLELAQRQLRVGAEDAVDRPAGEARARPAPAAAPARRGRGNRACAGTACGRPGRTRRPPARTTPCSFTSSPAGRHALRLAERAHGRGGLTSPNDAVDAVFRKEAERGQALLDVFDGRPGVVSLNRVHARHGSALRPAAESGAACFHQSNRAARCRRAARPARGRGGRKRRHRRRAAWPLPGARSRRSRSRTPRAAKAGR